MWEDHAYETSSEPSAAKSSLSALVSSSLSSIIATTPFSSSFPSFSRPSAFYSPSAIDLSKSPTPKLPALPKIANPLQSDMRKTSLPLKRSVSTSSLARVQDHDDFMLIEGPSSLLHQFFHHYGYPSATTLAHSRATARAKSSPCSLSLLSPCSSQSASCST